MLPRQCGILDAKSRGRLDAKSPGHLDAAARRQLDAKSPGRLDTELRGHLDAAAPWTPWHYGQLFLIFRQNVALRAAKFSIFGGIGLIFSKKVLFVAENMGYNVLNYIYIYIRFAVSP